MGLFDRYKVFREPAPEKRPEYTGPARDAILESIVAERDRGPLKPAARAMLAARINEPPATIRPALPEDRIATFTQRFTQRGGTLARLASLEEVPGAVLAWLDARELSPHAHLSGPLAALVWPTRCRIDYSAAGRDSVLSVSLAQLGIVETGSLLFSSSVDTPTTHNFVPEHQIVVLHRQDMVMHLEDAWAALRARGKLPRAVNLVAGPSRTGDIEQTIQLGAHGPRSLHVLLVG